MNRSKAKGTAAESAVARPMAGRQHDGALTTWCTCGAVLAERERIAQEIEARRDNICLAGSVLDRAARGWEVGYLDAARIVRGES